MYTVQITNFKKVIQKISL